MKCTVQMFLGDEWIDCAEIAATPNGWQWSYLVMYSLEHIDTPLSLVQPVDARQNNSDLLPAFAYDLLPQGQGRRFLLGELKLRDGPAADFPLLTTGAFNPIGRLRIAEAADYFETHTDKQHPKTRSLPGLTRDDVVLRSADFSERMFLHGMLGTGTTGVQGAAPKYLLTSDRAGLLHGDAILEDSKAIQHFIVKLPRGNSAADKKLLRNEAAYMHVAAELGIRTHQALPFRHGDADVLFIPRFDRIARDGKVERLHQESLASILCISGFDARPSLFDVVAGIRHVVTDPATETLEFIKRDVLNLAMRNTDNHARNTAVQVINGRAQLTPLFDFSPMYLDPEAIPRALRWYKPDTRIELTDWGDVLAALPIGVSERSMLAASLSKFANKVERLPAIMEKQGVDHDIISFLTHSVASQVRQLRALRPSEPDYAAPEPTNP